MSITPRKKPLRSVEQGQAGGPGGAATRNDPRGGDGPPPSPLDEDASAAPDRKKPLPSPACVGQRVDWLTLAYVPEHKRLTRLIEGFEAELRSYRRLTHHGGAVEETAGFAAVPVLVRGVNEQMTARAKGAGTVLLEGATGVSAVLAREASGGWGLVVTFAGTWFLEHSQVDAVAWARALARHCGWTGERGAEPTERVRRVDLAADFADFELRRADMDAWIKPSRGQVAQASMRVVERRLERGEVVAHELQRAEQDACVYTSGSHEVTGLYVCKGGDLSLRLYDKSLELACCSPEKTDAEHAHWRAAGWSGQGRVTRVEYQLRGEVLRELGLRDDVDALLTRLDSVWRYCVDWARLVDRTSATRLTRCALDARWQVVQEVVWRERQQPAKRVRVRSGASAEQTLGTLFSCLARTDELPARSELIDEDGVVLDVAWQDVESLRIEEVRSTARGLLDGLGRWGDLLHEQLVERHLPPEFDLEDQRALAQRAKAERCALVRLIVAWDRARTRAHDYREHRERRALSERELLAGIPEAA